MPRLPAWPNSTRRLLGFGRRCLSPAKQAGGCESANWGGFAARGLPGLPPVWLASLALPQEPGSGCCGCVVRQPHAWHLLTSKTWPPGWTVVDFPLWCSLCYGTAGGPMCCLITRCNVGRYRALLTSMRPASIRQRSTSRGCSEAGSWRQPIHPRCWQLAGPRQLSGTAKSASLPGISLPISKFCMIRPSSAGLTAGVTGSSQNAGYFPIWTE